MQLWSWGWGGVGGSVAFTARRHYGKFALRDTSAAARELSGEFSLGLCMLSRITAEASPPAALKRTRESNEYSFAL